MYILLKSKFWFLVIFLELLLFSIANIGASPVNAQTDVIVNETTRTVENSQIKISWDLNNAERVSGLYFKPFNTTWNLAGTNVDEFTGGAATFYPSSNNSITHDLVTSASTNTTWHHSRDGNVTRVEISSVSKEGYNIITRYEFVADNPVFKIVRTFGFGSKSIDASRLVSYTLRAYDRENFNLYAWEKSGGGVGTSGGPCEYGCSPDGWAQTWIDLEAPNLSVGLGLVNLYIGSQSQPWLDRDMNSYSAWIGTSIPNSGFNNDLTVTYLVVPHMGDYTDVDWANLSHWGVPTPFLDLPWDYQGGGLDFGEAITRIQSYFDHEYPFEDVGSILHEPGYAYGVTNFEGKLRDLTLLYSNHDGYDWIWTAGVRNGDLVLAAASGTASFLKADANNAACGSWACGNVILIDHGNGYQTRYYHLQNNDPISRSFAFPHSVNKGQPIGRVGSTGNSDIPHIHFSVIEDKNGDGDFQDNRPDGATDPFGWQSFRDDPWPNYSFFYNGRQRSGNKSYYLWEKRIPELKCMYPTNDGICGLERFGVWFPPYVEGEVNMRYAPSVRMGENSRSLGSSVQIALRDALGNLVNELQDFFTLNINFTSSDLSGLNANSLSIYSSSDGINWAREDTTVDMQTMTASARLRHLSYFALMAERLDITDPTTNAILTGTKGEIGQFRGDVQVKLEANDNEGGLGVYYIGYNVDHEYFREYTQPFTISSEGQHTIEFYSVDKDENIEEVKTETFSIEKADLVPPEAVIIFNPVTLDTEINGVDDVELGSTETIDLGNGKKSVKIFDRASNFIELIGTFDLSREVDTIGIEKVNYNNGLSKSFVFNRYQSMYKFDSSNNLLNITQTWQTSEAGITKSVQVAYRKRTDDTRVIVKELGKPNQEFIESGMRLLTIKTDKGKLIYNY